MFVPSPRSPLLKEQEVHLWRAGLDLTGQRVQKLKETLSADEVARAARFRFPRDRDRFTVARGVLRTILARYLDRDPRDVRVCYTGNGKPALIPELGGDTFRFNLAHSDGVALYAFAARRDLGIDLERITEEWTGGQVAKQFFSRHEADGLRRLPVHMRQRAFLRLWTQREALIKAYGENLSALATLSNGTPMHGDVPSALCATGAAPGSLWRTYELFFDPDYAAALAVEERDWRLRCWQWAE